MWPFFVSLLKNRAVIREKKIPVSSKQLRDISLVLSFTIESFSFIIRRAWFKCRFALSLIFWGCCPSNSFAPDVNWIESWFQTVSPCQKQCFHQRWWHWLSLLNWFSFLLHAIHANRPASVFIAYSGQSLIARLFRLEPGDETSIDGRGRFRVQVIERYFADWSTHCHLRLSTTTGNRLFPDQFSKSPTI